MRKALLILAAMLCSMAMYSQLLPSGTLKMQHAPYSLKSITHQMTAPSRIDLADNQMIMGHYDTDDVADSEDGLGLTSLTGTRRLGTILTPQE